MIYIDKVSYKNILSVGNAMIEFPLDGYSKTLVTGTNGAGKSTFLEALCFGFYGKPFRKINKPLLVNTINKKNLYVVIEFHDERHSYRIERGISKNIFEIYVDGKKPIGKSGTADYQDILETQILKFNMETFKQIVVLGTAGYTPFMDLVPSKRRSVIEDLLDISIFTTMNDINKKEVKKLKSDITLVTTDIDNKKSQINIHRAYQEKLKSQSTDRIDSLKVQINDLNDQINLCNGHLKPLNDKLDELHSKMIEDVSDKLQKATNRIYELQSKMNDINGQMKFIDENDNCPYCKQKIGEDHKSHMRSHSEETLSKYTDTSSKLKTAKEKLENRIQVRNKIQGMIDNINQKLKIKSAEIAGYKRQIDSVQKEIDTLTNKDSQEDKSREIVELENEVAELESRKEQLKEDLHCRQIISDLLHDTGVKRLIIKKYIPTLNKLINKYLKLLGGNYVFTVDEEFNEVIKSRGREKFVYNSFSQGEKSRIDLSIMFAFRDLVTIRSGQSCNLLVMDEVLDSANDASGVDNINTILQSIDANVIIISHNEKHLDSDFDRFIKFKKVGNFTKQV